MVEMNIMMNKEELLFYNAYEEFYMMVEVREKIDVMLKEVKLHLSSEIYHELTSLCDSVYDGAIFENEQYNAFVER